MAVNLLLSGPVALVYPGYVFRVVIGEQSGSSWCYKILNPLVSSWGRTSSQSIKAVQCCCHVTSRWVWTILVKNYSLLGSVISIL